jgi:hypothetical protein
MGRLAGAWRGNGDGKGPSPANIRDIFSRLPSGPGPRGPPGKPGKPGAQVGKYLHYHVYFTLTITFTITLITIITFFTTNLITGFFS